MTQRYQRDFSQGLSGKYKLVTERLPPRGSVLEIGCSTGYFTQLLADRGYDVIGVEYDVDAVTAARQRGLEVIHGDVGSPETLRSIRGPFDAILLMDVLEHLRDPEPLLRQLRFALKPSGRLICTGPNVAYWWVRKQLLLGRWDYEDAGIMDRTHLRFYNEKTWRELFERSGYNVEDLESAEGMIPLEGRLQRVPGLSAFVTRMRELAILFAPRLFTVVYFIEARLTKPNSAKV